MARNSPRDRLALDLPKAKFTKQNLREAATLFIYLRPYQGLILAEGNVILFSTKSMQLSGIRVSRNRYLESAMNQTESDTRDAWEQFAPFLDEAVAQLNDAERAALVLRFYEQRPLIKVGEALGVGEDAAQKRVTRALEKLRGLFVKRCGVSLKDHTANTIAAFQEITASLAKAHNDISQVRAQVRQIHTSSFSQ